MKKYFIYAATALALGACSSDDYLGQSGPDGLESKNGAILFKASNGATTRAGEHVGADAASLLDNKFVVEGDKSANGADFNAVFDDYSVKYTASTANTTESNTADWEYVGGTPATTSGVSGTTQTIKYWDYSQKLYNFAAYSLGGGSATATAINVTPNAATGNIASYTLSGSAANLTKCYISDLVTAYNQAGVSDFGKTVTMKFRSLGTKVRVAFYETIPGYSVKNVQFYTVATGGTASNTVALFTADKVLPSGEGTMAVSFPTTGWDKRSDPDYNKAHVAFTPKAADSDMSSVLTFANELLYGAKEVAEAAGDYYLGRSSNQATYAKEDASATGYNVVLPNEAGANLQLRVKYTLVSTDGSGEEIVVDNARAVIPAAYGVWKPNYAYTYIFKISDNTNGSTGVDGDGNIVEGLTPITFDAVVTETEDGVQETITTVATPSITTYQEGKVVTSYNEYEAGDIYASVMNGTTAVNLSSLTSPAGVAVYVATATDPKIITEALVQDQLNGTKHDTGITLAAAGYELVSEVPAVDGNTLSVSACKFTVATGKTYVFQYTDGSKNYVKVIRVK